MKDERGFEIRCEFSDWKIVDARDNHDYVCSKYFTGGTHVCYCDDHCKDYKPVKADKGRL